MTSGTLLNGGMIIIGHIIDVTGHAIRSTGCIVIEVHIPPTAGVMAGRALQIVMVGWRVAVVTGYTIGGIVSSVVKGCTAPTAGIMAGRAL